MAAPIDMTHRLGSKVVAIGASAVTTVLPFQTQNAGFFKIIGGGGSLFIIDGPTFIDSATLPVVGYPVGATEIVSFQGAAQFYLACTGATMTIAIGVSYSSRAGASGFIV